MKNPAGPSYRHKGHAHKAATDYDRLLEEEIIADELEAYNEWLEETGWDEDSEFSDAIMDEEPEP